MESLACWAAQERHSSVVHAVLRSVDPVLDDTPLSYRLHFYTLADHVKDFDRSSFTDYEEDEAIGVVLAFDEVFKNWYEDAKRKGVKDIAWRVARKQLLELLGFTRLFSIFRITDINNLESEDELQIPQGFKTDKFKNSLSNLFVKTKLDGYNDNEAYTNLIEHSCKNAIFPFTMLGKNPSKSILFDVITSTKLGGVVHNILTFIRLVETKVLPKLVLRIDAIDEEDVEEAEAWTEEEARTRGPYAHLTASPAATAARKSESGRSAKEFSSSSAAQQREDDHSAVTGPEKQDASSALGDKVESSRILRSQVAVATNNTKAVVRKFNSKNSGLDPLKDIPVTRSNRRRGDLAEDDALTQDQYSTARLEDNDDKMQEQKKSIITARSSATRLNFEDHEQEDGDVAEQPTTSKRRRPDLSDADEVESGDFERLGSSQKKAKNLKAASPKKDLIARIKEVSAVNVIKPKHYTDHTHSNISSPGAVVRDRSRGLKWIPWTYDEEEALKAGIERHGFGNWVYIKKDPDFRLGLKNRSNVDLKDKARNMRLKGIIPVDD